MSYHLEPLNSCAYHSSVTIPPGYDMKGFITAILKVDAKSYSGPEAFFERNRNFFYAQPDYSEVGREVPDESDLSTQIQTRLAATSASDWTMDRLQSEINKIISNISSSETSTSEEDSSAVQKRTSNRVLQFLRQEVMASRPGPAMSETMAILGRKRTLSRLRSGSQNRAF